MNAMVRHGRPDEPSRGMNPRTEPNFAVHVSPGPHSLIAVRGEFDLAAAPVFEAAFDGVDFVSLRRVLLDLEGLDFIDASGLRAVLALHARCSHASVALAITPGPRRVQRVFELTGAGPLLPFSRR
jgi:anti-sigma B factor antagonist